MKYPPPYTELTDSEMVIYNRLWKAIELTFEITEDVDNFIVTGAAQALNMSAEAMERIRQESNGEPIQRYENGTRQVSPDYTIARTRMMDAAKLLRDAGLTLSERMKNKPEVVEEKPDDIIEQLMKGVVIESKKDGKNIN